MNTGLAVICVVTAAACLKLSNAFACLAALASCIAAFAGNTEKSNSSQCGGLGACFECVAQPGGGYTCCDKCGTTGEYDVDVLSGQSTCCPQGYVAARSAAQSEDTVAPAPPRAASRLAGAPAAAAIRKRTPAAARMGNAARTAAASPIPPPPAGVARPGSVAQSLAVRASAPRLRSWRHAATRTPVRVAAATPTAPAGRTI